MECEMKFLHCADIHLDSPLQGIAKHPDGPVGEIRIATRAAFENVVRAAISEAVDFVLIAGDLYDTSLQSFESALFFNRQMSKLREADIRVFLTYGNHDAAVKLVKNLGVPDNVRVLSPSHPETIKDEALGVAVHGQSFAKQAVTEDLAANYPPAVPGLFNIGILHTNLGGNTAHENYAPSTLLTLVNKGYQYWALGHVHNRELMHESPWIVYPGNTQARQIREAGDKTCELVTVADTGQLTLQPITTSAVPWYLAEIDCTHSASLDEIFEKVAEQLKRIVARAEGKLAVVRVVLAGPCAAHAKLISQQEKVRNEITSLALQADGPVWIERVVVQTAPLLNVAELLQRQDPLGEVLRTLRSLPGDPVAIAEITDSFRDFRKKLPHEISTGPEPLVLDELYVSKALAKVENLLLVRLSETEAE
jgi:DNA repair exonuclease SbcCD nuclease subunit